MCHEWDCHEYSSWLYSVYSKSFSLNSLWRNNFELFHDKEGAKARQIAVSVGTGISVSSLYPHLVLEAPTDPPCCAGNRVSHSHHGNACMHALRFGLLITLVLGDVFYPPSLGKFKSLRPNGLKLWPRHPISERSDLLCSWWRSFPSLFFFLLFFFMVLTLSHLPRNWGDLLLFLNSSMYVRNIFSIASCSVNRSWPYHRECKWSYHNVLLKICCIMHRRKVWVTCAFYYFYLFFLLHSALWGLDALSLCCAALATEAEQDEEAFLLNTAVSL